MCQEITQILLFNSFFLSNKSPSLYRKLKTVKEIAQDNYTHSEKLDSAERVVTFIISRIINYQFTIYNLRTVVV